MVGTPILTVGGGGGIVLAGADMVIVRVDMVIVASRNRYSSSYSM